MRDHRIDLLNYSEGKNLKNKNSPKRKGFGYQVLGFGAGDAGRQPYTLEYLVVAGGGAGGATGGGCGSAGGGDCR